MNRQRQRGNSFGLMLLFYQLFVQTGIEAVPPLTLLIILIQTAIFTNVLDPNWGNFNESSLEARAVLVEGEYYRLFTAAFEHVSDMHLYYNMASFLYKGMRLERRYGSLNFAFITALLTLLSGLVHVLLAMLAAEMLEDEHFMVQRAVGFSGVIFALKVLVNNDNNDNFGNKLITWIAELILIQLAVPNASFIGHLAGILAGIVFCYALPIFQSLATYLRSHPLSLMLIALLLLLHNDLIARPWMRTTFFKSGSHTVCLNAKAIWNRNEWMRLVSAPLEHRSNLHLVISVFSLTQKALVLDFTMSLSEQLFTLLYSLLAPSLVYLGLVVGLNQSDVLCPMGLTMALFALKPLVLANLLDMSCSKLILLPLLVFEAVEALMLLETDTRLSLISGLISGLILIKMRRKERFPGQGNNITNEYNDYRYNRSSRRSRDSNFEPSAPPMWDEDENEVIRRQRLNYYYQ